jgi:serine/threonine protein kinase
VHRDIKPSNNLVAQHDHLAVPAVIDFGLAKAPQVRLTDATLFLALAQFIGTSAHMTPAQAGFSSLETDPRRDVYSLGVLRYELLTGRGPFEPKSLQQAGIDGIRRIIREVEPPRSTPRLSNLPVVDRPALAKLRSVLPTRHSTQLSGDLAGMVMHCLEKDRCAVTPLRTISRSTLAATGVTSRSSRARRPWRIAPANSSAAIALGSPPARWSLPR